MKTVKILLSTVLGLLVIIGSSSILITSIYAKNSTSSSVKPIKKLDLNFYGGGNSITIYPLPHSRHEYLIIMHNIKKLTAKDDKKGYQKELSIKELPSNLWKERGHDVLLMFSNSTNGDQNGKSYAFILKHFDYNYTTYDFIMYATAINVNKWIPYQATDKQELGEFKLFIDPVPELGYSFHKY